MHKLSSFVIGLSLSASLFAAGCASTTSPGQTQADGTMIANVNGTAWSATTVPLIGSAATAVLESSSNTLTIAGTQVALTGNSTTISLTLLNQTLGADSLGFGNTATYSVGTPGQDSYITAGFNAGVVNLTRYDTVAKLVSGTFTFTARQASNPLGSSVTVTSGSFVNVPWSRH